MDETLMACPCVGRTLDRLVQPAILALVAEGALHGYRLVERLRDMPGFAGHRPDPSGIYRVLKGMEARGLLVYSWDPSDMGPAKRTYQITPDGQRCLERWVDTLKEYRDRITLLLDTARKAAQKGDSRA